MTLGALGFLASGGRGAAADEAGARAECDRLAAFPYADASNDPGVPLNAIDADRAVVACSEVRAIGDELPPPRFNHQLGRAYHSQGDLDTAGLYYDLASTEGYRLADYSLGRLSLEAYRRDNTDLESLHEAHRLLLAGAEAGERHSQNALADFLELATPLKDEAAALAWRQRALDAGLPAAQYTFGYWHEIGRTVERDMAKALAYMETAKGYGYPPAFGRLAYYYDIGRGVGRDKDKALALYRQGAALGDPFSHEMLADKYHKGENLPRDFGAVRKHLYKAHTGGSRTAYARLAALSIQSKDIEDAAYYARVAVESGNMGALELLLIAHCIYYCPEDSVPNRLKTEDKRTEAERREGAAWAIIDLTKIAKGSNEDAARDAAASLGTFYRGGMRGLILVDKTRARHWYERAAALGDEDARRALSEMDVE